MRVNVYAEEITNRIELVQKKTDEGNFIGVRFYLELPVSLSTPRTTLGGQPGITQVRGPFMHRLNDDDSSAVTFWGKRDLKKILQQAINLLDQHHENKHNKAKDPWDEKRTTDK